MEWFYALSNKQHGPVDSTVLRSLHQTGTISNETLVWHAGLERWKTFTEAAPHLDAFPQSDAPAIAPEDAAICAHSGRVGNKDAMLKYGEYWLLPENKDAFVAALQLGARSGARQDVSTMQPVGFWWRVIAYMVDFVILTVGGVLCAIPFLVLGGFSILKALHENDWVPDFNTLPEPTTAQLLIGGGLFFILFIALIIFYHIYLVGKYGGTPGKRLLKFKIVAADGKTLSYARAAGRFFASLGIALVAGLISELITYLSGISFSPGTPPAAAAAAIVKVIDLVLGNLAYLWVAWDKKKRALYDHVAGTYVVRD